MERNVRSSSAVEGISKATFRSATSGASVKKCVDSENLPVKARAKKK